MSSWRARLPCIDLLFFTSDLKKINVHFFLFPTPWRRPYPARDVMMSPVPIVRVHPMAGRPAAARAEMAIRSLKCFTVATAVYRARCLVCWPWS